MLFIAFKIIYLLYGHTRPHFILIIKLITIMSVGLFLTWHVHFIRVVSSYSSSYLPTVCTVSYY